MKYHIIGAHAALNNLTGNNVSLSSCCRVFNAETSGFQIITVQTSAGALIGDIHLNFGQSIDIHKDPSDVLLTDGGVVFATPVALNA